MGKSIKRNFFYNVLLNISKVIFPLITAPYISRVLEPDGVGLFNFANTYAGYFALFAALGIPYYGVREIAKVRDSVEGQTRFVSEIMSLLSISTVVSVIAFLGSLVLVPQLTENHLIFIISDATKNRLVFLWPRRVRLYHFPVFGGEDVERSRIVCICP